MRHSKVFTATLMIAILALTGFSNPGKEISVTPVPVSIMAGNGNFRLKPTAIIAYNSDEAKAEATFLGNMLRPATGYELKTAEGVKGDIILSIDTKKQWKPEEYNLTVTKKKVAITAGSSAGLFRGIQTLRQLLPADIESAVRVQPVNWTIPCVAINDYPRFAWRGMHLDVSRHFFDVNFVKRYIDLIAMHKMNVFHWHLVDDQGWRIEIKKYPKLTEVGAWRVNKEDKPWSGREAAKPGEVADFGGFYTQEEVKEIVAYAAERHITVVPEIEMPAHVSAALAAYPEYSCTGGPFTVPTGGVWPITDIYCAGKDETFKFIEDVLTEVIALFPSEYIHVGGDEANKKEWKKCPLCQERIKKEGLKDEAELQSYFIKRIEKFISSQGRKLIGWDEILEGGLAPGAAVMSWRGFEGGVEAAKSGHYVVMSPVSHCYFDYYQGEPATEPKAFGGYTTLQKVYNFEPVPLDLTAEESKYILGAQANLWTESVTTTSHAEYMVVPRMSALAEVLWSPKESHNWEEFNARLTSLKHHFDIMGVNYAHGSYRVDIETSFDETNSSATINMKSEQIAPEIHYTLDSSEPTAASPLFREPFKITQPTTIKTAIFDNGKPLGIIYEKRVCLNKATGKSVKYTIAPSNKYRAGGQMTLVNGITGSDNFSDGQWQGFEGNDLEVIIDLGSEMQISSVSAGFISSPASWIFFPQHIEFFVSADGINFKSAGKVVNEKLPKDQTTERINLTAEKISLPARYVKVFAKNLGLCPEGHEGAGKKCWMFTDEIVVE